MATTLIIDLNQCFAGKWAPATPPTGRTLSAQLYDGGSEEGTEITDGFNEINPETAPGVYLFTFTPPSGFGGYVHVTDGSNYNLDLTVPEGTSSVQNTDIVVMPVAINQDIYIVSATGLLISWPPFVDSTGDPVELETPVTMQVYIDSVPNIQVIETYTAEIINSEGSEPAVNIEDTDWPLPARLRYSLRTPSLELASGAFNVTY